MEMRMLRWMCQYTRRDRIRNEKIGDNVGEASTEDKMLTEIVQTCEEEMH